MSRMLQVRNLPDQIHRTLKSRAAREGMTLSDFVKRELQNSASLPTQQEWLDRVARAKPVRSDRTAAQIIRALRDSR